MAALLATLRARRPVVDVLAALACFSLLGFALYTQHYLGFEPCPLCIFQRIAVIALGVAFVLAALVPARARLAGIASAALIALVALAGCVVSGRHLYLQSFSTHGPGDVGSCGAPLGLLWEVNPTSEFLAKVFRGTGDCSHVDWTFLAIPMPGWVLIWLLGLGIAGVLVNWRPRAPR